MRRSLALLAVIAVLAAPTAVSGGQAKQDYVTGSAKFTAVDAHVIVSAHSGPAGEDPRGHFSLDQAGLVDIWAEVTCLNVSGNRAAIAGVVVKDKIGFPGVGTYVLQLVLDNGSPGDTDESQTLINWFDPDFCPLLPFGTIRDQGNYVVHDAP
jgi:hypothetical protein